MFDHNFYYSALDYKSLVELIDLNNLEIINETKKYKDLNEERDLIILARKKEQVIK